MAAQRHAWRAGQPDLDPERLIFIDETGASTKMARLYGRSLRGSRCRAAIPHGHWKTITFVGGLTIAGMTAPMMLDGAMDGPAFLAWVQQMLAPALLPGQIVVMDNLPAHKPEAVRAAIEAKGAELRYLPPYSPDLNPIEMAYSKRFSRRPPHEPSTNSATPLQKHCPRSRPAIVEATSPRQDTVPYDRNLL